MQAIEGDDAAVDELMASIKKDGRHKNIKIILEQPVSKCLLEDLPFKLTSVYDNNLAFIQYINTYKPMNYPLRTPIGLVFKDAREGELSDKKNPKPGSHFARFNISLLNWPTFDLIQPTRELLEL